MPFLCIRAQSAQSASALLHQGFPIEFYRPRCNIVPIIPAADKIGSLLFHLFNALRIIADFLQDTPQIIRIALFKRQSVFFGNGCAFLDVRCHHAAAVAHRFEQAQRHPFQIAGQNKRICVAVQLLSELTIYKAREQDAFVARRKLFKLIKIRL